MVETNDYNMFLGAKIRSWWQVGGYGDKVGVRVTRWGLR